MASLENFLGYINARNYFLDDGQSKALYSSVLLTPDWKKVFCDIHDADFHKTLENKITTYINNLKNGTPEEEYKEMLSKHIECMRVPNMSVDDFKQHICCKSKELSSFVQLLESKCDKSLKRTDSKQIKSNDVVSMYLHLAVGGTEMLERNSPKLWHKDRESLLKHYMAYPIANHGPGYNEALAIILGSCE
jgi:hypothetical protein